MKHDEIRTLYIIAGRRRDIENASENDVFYNKNKAVAVLNDRVREGKLSELAVFEVVEREGVNYTDEGVKEYCKYLDWEDAEYVACLFFNEDTGEVEDA